MTWAEHVHPLTTEEWATINNETENDMSHRTIQTQAELAALPNETVIRDSNAITFERHYGMWIHPRYVSGGRYAPKLPATILWEAAE